MAEKEVKEKSKAEEPTKNNELAVKILGVMETLRSNGIVEVTSTVLRDKVGTKNRAIIRRTMKGLVKTGKVEISERKVGKRKQYLYRLT